MKLQGVFEITRLVAQADNETAFTATALRITGSGGDAYYSVSELQAWGRAKP